MLVHSISFKVKGVTFENEDGNNIQTEIKKILKEYKDNNYFDILYSGYANSEIKEMDLNVSEYEGYKFPAKLVGDEYNGEECLKIYIKTYNNEFVHIGYAPKDNLEEISEWLNKKDLNVDGKIEVVGGKYKHTELYEEDYEEKEKVVTEELTYGIEVALNFCDSQVDPQFIKMKEKEKSIETSQNTATIIAWIIALLIMIWVFSKVWSFINWLVD